MLNEKITPQGVAWGLNITATPRQAGGLNITATPRQAGGLNVTTNPSAGRRAKCNNKPPGRPGG